ncbi:MAG: integrase/recombinase XerD [Actinomycetota bacterium]|jgi:site-specific recombinase XerD|nr:integrase/recombinase XerD [Actinomycetota bacterium]
MSGQSMMAVDIADTEETATVHRLGDLTLRYVNERERRGEIRGETVRTYRLTLGTFVKVVGWDLAPSRLRQSHVERWQERKPLSIATKRSQLSIVRTFCRWLVRRGFAQRDATLDLASPRQPRYVPRGIDREAVGDALAGCPDVRAELIVSLEVQEGLRACEVCNLELGDIDTELRVMMVRGKGGHERILPITRETWAVMERYRQEHPAAAGPLVRSYLNPTKGLSAHYVSRLVSGWMHGAGVGASGHALRHTAATDMLRSGAHVRDVQNALGHTSLATTQRYMPWLVGDLREAMEGRTYRRPVQATLF